MQSEAKCLMKIFMSNKKRLTTIISILVIILVWEVVSLVAGSPQLMPGPWPTLKAVSGMLCQRSFLAAAGITVLRALAGFAIAIAAGGILGIAGGLNESVGAFIKPWVVVIRSTPVVAIVLLAIIWLGQDTVPVFIGALTMFPIIYLNIEQGIRHIDRKTVEMARFYGLRGRRIVGEIYVPAIRPHVFSGISTAVGMGWRAIVVGEVLCQPEWGIGTAMHSAQTFLQVDILIAWTLVTILVGAVFEKIIKFAEKRF